MGDETLPADRSANGSRHSAREYEREEMTIVQITKEDEPATPDLTLVPVVVPCNVCGNPVCGERFAFAKDEDIIGKLVHFECAAATINQ